MAAGSSAQGRLRWRRFVAQGLEPGALGGDLVVAEDQGMRRAAAIGRLELRLEAAAAAVHGQPQAWQRVAQALREQRTGALRGLAHGHEIDVRAATGAVLAPAA